MVVQPFPLNWDVSLWTATWDDPGSFRGGWLRHQKWITKVLGSSWNLPGGQGPSIPKFTQLKNCWGEEIPQPAELLAPVQSTLRSQLSWAAAHAGVDFCKRVCSRVASAVLTAQPHTYEQPQETHWFFKVGLDGSYGRPCLSVWHTWGEGTSNKKLPSLYCTADMSTDIF